MFTVGEKVTIIKSPHPDVANGTTGTVDSALNHGCGVEVEALFYIQSGGHKKERRVIYVDNNQLSKTP